MSDKLEHTRSLAELAQAADLNRTAFINESRNLQDALDAARQQIRRLDMLYERMEQYQVDLVCKRIGDTGAIAVGSTQLPPDSSR